MISFFYTVLFFTLGLCGCVAFSGCGEWGLLFVAAWPPEICRAGSGEPGLQQLGSPVLEPGLSSCGTRKPGGSCCEILRTRGWGRCPLHLQGGHGHWATRKTQVSTLTWDRCTAYLKETHFCNLDTPWLLTLNLSKLEPQPCDHWMKTPLPGRSHRMPGFLSSKQLFVW